MTTFRNVWQFLATFSFFVPILNNFWQLCHPLSSYHLVIFSSCPLVIRQSGRLCICHIVNLLTCHLGDYELVSKRVQRNSVFHSAHIFSFPGVCLLWPAEEGPMIWDDVCWTPVRSLPCFLSDWTHLSQCPLFFVRSLSYFSLFLVKQSQMVGCCLNTCQIASLHLVWLKTTLSVGKGWITVAALWK